MATKQFVDNFKLVSGHYMLSGSEVEEAKQCARDNMADAEICYQALADEIRGEK